MSTPNRFREPSQSSRMLRLLMFLPPVILDASTTLFRRPEPFLSHLPIISSVAPSGRVRSLGNGILLRRVNQVDATLEDAAIQQLMAQLLVGRVEVGAAPALRAGVIR